MTDRRCHSPPHQADFNWAPVNRSKTVRLAGSNLNGGLISVQVGVNLGWGQMCGKSHNWTVLLVPLNVQASPSITYQKITPTDDLLRGRWLELNGADHFAKSNDQISQVLHVMRSTETFVTQEHCFTSLRLDQTSTGPIVSRSLEHWIRKKKPRKILSLHFISIDANSKQFKTCNTNHKWPTWGTQKSFSRVLLSGLSMEYDT